MTKIILVSLIHNRKGFVGSSIQSAINQLPIKSKWMHLLIDNKSTDGADKIAEVFAKRYNNIKLIKMNDNLGQQKAYNYVLDTWLPNNFQDADVMSILDSDDILMPSALSEVEKMFDAHQEIGGAYSGFGIIDANGRWIVKNHGKAKLVPNQFTEAGQKQLRKIFISNNPCGHLRSYRIKCLRDIGGFDTNYEFATDYNVFGRLLEKYPVVKIDKVLYAFRQHKDQVQSKHSPQQTKDWQDMQKEFRERWTKMGII